MRLLLVSAALAAATLIAPHAALAQRGGYYQPRVYNSPPPQHSRDAYVQGGSVVGGLGGMGVGAVAGNFVGGPVAGGYASGAGGIVGSAAGGYYGGRAYDNQASTMTQRYYYAPYMGVQTTTPYMVRVVPRH
jgi:hypothetical protein